MLAAMRRLVPALLLAASLGCKVDGAPEQPVEGHLELCCRSGGPLEFSGCRASGQCRAAESIWLRGPMSCGPVEPETCAGGRCCVLELPGTREPIEPEPTAPPEPREEPPPPPAPIEPVPFE